MGSSSQTPVRFRQCPPTHNRASSANERPAVMPADPAVTAAERFERRYVREGRARRVSWFHLAQQLGRCEADLRRLHGDD